MKSATAKELKTELALYSSEKLVNICLRLSRFKKENKELLTYLLFEADNEDYYIQSLKEEIDLQFEAINKTQYYFIKKSVRKILSSIKKHVRYSQKTETEIELLLYFCMKLERMKPSFRKNVVLTNTYNRQLELAKKKILLLDDDLQYDYKLELEKLA